MKGKCPFNSFKDCREQCVFYRKGIRYFDDERKSEPFEECAINVGVDCLENLVGRSIGNQKATEETRNQVLKLNELFYGLANAKLLEKE